MNQLSRLTTNALFATLFTRGVLELALPKKVALFLQFALLLALATLFFFPRESLKERKGVLTVLLLLVLDVVTSAVLTASLDESLEFLPFFLFTLGILWLFYLLVRPLPNMPAHFAEDLIKWGWILFIAALLEALHLVELPGFSSVFVYRSASLTGSFLHYPILIALIGFVALERRERLAALLFLAAPFLVASRSGALIVLSGLFLYPLFSKGRGALQIFLTLLLVGLLSFGTLQLAPKSKAGKLIDRVVGAAEASSAGNRIRIATWKSVTNAWLKSNLLIGEGMGKITNLATYTNAAQKARWGRYNVSESSPLELLVNFGLIGCLLYYALLLSLFQFLPNMAWLKAGLLGGILQTFVYQSIEVIPYITLLLFFPAIASSIVTHSFTRSDGQKISFTLG